MGILDNIKNFFGAVEDEYEEEPAAVEWEAHAVTFNGPAGAERAITRLYNLFNAKHLDNDGPKEIIHYQHKVASFGYEIPTNAAECVALLDSLKG